MPEIQSKPDGSGSQSANNKSFPKDDTAMSHEIATLLLKLGRTHEEQPASTNDKSQKHSSVMKSDSEAIDLSTCSKPMPEASFSKTNTESRALKSSSSSLSAAAAASFQNSALSVPTTVNPYSLFNPSLAMASMASTPIGGLGSTYLLQNLLIGKMQQQMVASSGQPLTPDTQSLAATTGQAGSLTLSQPLVSTNQSLSSSSSSLATNNTATSLAGSRTVAGQPMGLPTASSIPLLSGKIVTQLNSLLFSVHGLTDKAMEMNVQGQLAAIFTRLQEIVAMVELAKNKQDKSSAKKPDDGIQKLDIHKQLDYIKTNKQKEEEKIARQLEEYQKALVKSQNEGQTVDSQGILGQLKPSVAHLLKKGHDGIEFRVSADTDLGASNLLVDTGADLGQDMVDCQEVDSSSLSAAARRRRGRPPKEGGLPEGPPEKKGRNSPTGLSVLAPTSTGNRKSGKGGKGIRNRVFCGDCPGCLKNDDCGQCRYCRDKTKFGGQNRLRQKCLHRRCQMDTHRRSGSNSAAGNASQQNRDIYSGVELARLATHQHQEDSAALSPGEVVRSPSGHPIFASFLGNSSLLSEESEASKPVFVNNHHEEPSKHEAPAEEEDDDKQHSEEKQSGLSRINKWKAKHEAMLKMAAENGHSVPKDEDAKSDSPLVVDVPRFTSSRGSVSSDASQPDVDCKSSVTEDGQVPDDQPPQVNGCHARKPEQGEASPTQGESLAPRFDKSQNNQNQFDEMKPNGTVAASVEGLKQKLKSVESSAKKEPGRLTTRSMKTAVAF